MDEPTNLPAKAGSFLAGLAALGLAACLSGVHAQGLPKAAPDQVGLSPQRLTSISDPQLVRMIEVIVAHRMWMQFEAREVGHPGQRGCIAWYHFFSRATRWEFQCDDVDPGRA